jgi:hypothetical protein
MFEVLSMSKGIIDAESPRHGGTNVKNGIKYCHLLQGLLPVLLGVLAVGGLSLGAQPASALEATGNVCLETLFGSKTNCTAEDVKIAKAINVSVAKCTEGTTIPELTGTFEVLLSGKGSIKSRLDIGLYFDVHGDVDSNGNRENNGARGGTCQLNTIPIPPGVNLDGDVCGDVDTAHNDLFVTITLHNVSCVDTDGDGRLNLPNCVSWQTPGQDGVCTQATQAIPGSSSKCKCDDAFNIPVEVERPGISVTKAADPDTLNEPGGSVDFAVTVHNDGAVVAVDLTELVDDPDNNPATNNSITYNATSTPSLATICGNNTHLDPGESTTCTFTRTVTGEPGKVTDKACVSGHDANNNAIGPTCATATVTIVGVNPSAAVTKIATTAVVTFEVTVHNLSTAEQGFVDALCDDKYGAIATHGIFTCTAGTLGTIKGTTCSVPQTLGINGTSGDSYTCTFEAEVSIDGSEHTDTVTGTVSDNDGNSVPTQPGSAKVTVTATHNP